MEDLTPYELWQIENYGNIADEFSNIFSPDEDELRQDIPCL